MPIQSKQQPPYYTAINQIKLYTALLTQTGTNAPTANVLQNTTGETITWNYDSPGIYPITTTNPLFTTNKVTIQIGAGNTDPVYYKAYEVTNQELGLETWNIFTQANANDLLLNTFIQITIYV